MTKKYDPPIAVYNAIGGHIEVTSDQFFYDEAKRIVKSWIGRFRDEATDETSYYYALRVDIKNMDSVLRDLAVIEISREKLDLLIRSVESWHRLAVPYLDTNHRVALILEKALDRLMKRKGLNRNEKEVLFGIALDDPNTTRADVNYLAVATAAWLSASREIDETRDRYSSEKENLIKLRENLLTTSEKMNAQLEVSDALKNRLTSLFSEKSKEFNKLAALQAASAEDLKNLVEAERAKYELHAPAQFWQDKRDEHNQKKYWIGGVTMAWLSVGAGWVIANFFMGNYKTSITLAEGETVNWIAYLISIGPVLFLATIYLWIARLLVRLTLSEIHLQMDAEQRITMMESYISLIAEGSIVADAENSRSILNALFRPAQDGIVKDDASDNAVLNALLQKALK